MSEGLEGALRHLKCERRFFRDRDSVFATGRDTAELDTHLEQHQRQILDESSRRNELGLYRNASLVLGCLAIAQNDYDAALDYILDVAFLDIAGATNSVPGRPSFDARLSLVVPFVTAILRDLSSALELRPHEIESLFEARGQRFSAFGNPPVPLHQAWCTLLPRLRA